MMSNVSDQTPPQPSRRQWPAPPHGQQWPAYAPPLPKPETTLRAPLLWTAFFSFLGVILAAAALAVVIALLASLVYLLFFVAGAGETWNLFGFLGEVLWGIAGPAVVIVLAATSIVFIVCAGVLMLLRLIIDVRRWAPPLQALLACGLTYVGGGTVLWIVAQLASAFTT